jgi:hypothetical protein
MVGVITDHPILFPYVAAHLTNKVSSEAMSPLPSGVSRLGDSAQYWQLHRANAESLSGDSAKNEDLPMVGVITDHPILFPYVAARLTNKVSSEAMSPAGGG